MQPLLSFYFIFLVGNGNHTVETTHLGRAGGYQSAASHLYPLAYEGCHPRVIFAGHRVYPKMPATTTPLRGGINYESVYDFSEETYFSDLLRINERWNDPRVWSWSNVGRPVL